MKAQQRKAGRPPGSRNPTAKERIRDKLSGVYDATLRKALAGDGECARLCLDIAKNPSAYPDPEQENEAS